MWKQIEDKLREILIAEQIEANRNLIEELKQISQQVLSIVVTGKSELYIYYGKEDDEKSRTVPLDDRLLSAESQEYLCEFLEEHSAVVEYEISIKHELLERNAGPFVSCGTETTIFE